MKSIHTEIEIKASAEKVWSILTDFEHYGDWNPFIQKISGEAIKGGKLKAELHLPNSKPMTFKPTCLAAEENVEFRWLGHLLIPGIFDGEHIFKIKSIGENHVKFVQSENFKGILVGMMWKSINEKTVQGFEIMNRALKERAEADN